MTMTPDQIATMAEQAPGQAALWARIIQRTASQRIADTVAELEGTATGITSTRADGSWWFHVRRRDQTGAWSHPSHLGPFRIDTTPPESEQ